MDEEQGEVTTGNSNFYDGVQKNLINKMLGIV